MLAAYTERQQWRKAEEAGEKWPERNKTPESCCQTLWLPGYMGQGRLLKGQPFQTQRIWGINTSNDSVLALPLLPKKVYPTFSYLPLHPLAMRFLPLHTLQPSLLQMHFLHCMSFPQTRNPVIWWRSPGANSLFKYIFNKDPVHHFKKKKKKPKWENRNENNE